MTIGRHDVETCENYECYKCERYARQRIFEAYEGRESAVTRAHRRSDELEKTNERLYSQVRAMGMLLRQYRHKFGPYRD